ncbi:hypothetical protein [Rubrobacter calidifluminis]|uniref:hypothetical protein n=1 Tax=Rubrobacter calidifluminis TaxID=1392640 RepID=UPI00235EDD7D|nr:hypothetical protein [Rubrobacter calidifluminis]
MAEAARIEQIEAVINTLISRSEGEPLPGATDPVVYRDVLDVEVEPQQYPASTLLFSYPSQSDLATGGITQNTWRWIQRSYFDFTDPATAQQEMKRLIPALLSALRHASPDDLLLADGTQIELVVEDAGAPDRAEVGESSVLVKSLYITAQTEEE